MIWQRLVIVSLATSILLVDSGTADAAGFTGDPIADGWVFKGNSLTLGTYVRGTGNRDFDLYSSAFRVPNASPIINSKFLAGDLVFALGGVMLDGGTDIYRVLAKFGSGTATYSASSTLTPPGNGIGSQSAGGGGIGGIQMDRDLLFAGPAYSSSGITDSTEVFRWTGTIGSSGTLLNDAYGRTNAIFSSPGVLSSFEFLVNVDALIRDGFDPGPVLHTKSIISVQSSSFDPFTDGLVGMCFNSNGDANFDGVVNGLDYITWADNFGSTTKLGALAGDFNCSGDVDGLDYVIWADNFGSGSAALPNIMAVPEPATYASALCGGALLCWVGRRKLRRRAAAHGN